jgi:preprotein translocase subunit SecD
VGSKEKLMKRPAIRSTRSIAVSVVCSAWLLSSPLGAASQVAQPAATAFEMRLAETQPAAGLVEAATPDSSEKVYLHREAIVTNADVAQARVVPGITSVNFNVAVTFNPAGAAKMAKATASHLNKPVAILINGRVVAALTVRGQISDQAVISGDFDNSQASAIAAGLTRR